MRNEAVIEAMGTGRRIIIVAVATLALVVLSGWVDYTWRPARRTDEDSPGSLVKEDAIRDSAPEGSADASKQFADAWQSFHGPQYRLRRLTTPAASSPLAQSC